MAHANSYECTCRNCGQKQLYRAWNGEQPCLTEAIATCLGCGFKSVWFLPEFTDKEIKELSVRVFQSTNRRQSVENQHRKITGYRELSQSEIDYMNRVKELAKEVGALVGEMRIDGSLDTRWVNTGATDLQKGFMCLTRSIAKPDFF